MFWDAKQIFFFWRKSHVDIETQTGKLAEEYPSKVLENGASPVHVDEHDLPDEILDKKLRNGNMKSKDSTLSSSSSSATSRARGQRRKTKHSSELLHDWLFITFVPQAMYHICK